MGSLSDNLPTGNETNLNLETDTKLLLYNDSCFHLKRTSKRNFSVSKQKSKFDDLILSKWDHAMLNNFFRYNLDDVKRKTLPGCVGLIAQLNSKRFSERRPPQSITSICQPFSSDGFNFNKVKENEILFKMKASDCNCETDEHILMINVSPIEYGHILIVPNAKKCLPQVLTEDSIKLAMETCFLSGSRDFRLGFNSLCAFASVNHLHFHAIYIDDILPIDNAPVKSVNNDLFVLDDYPVHGFAFSVSYKDINTIARKVYIVVNYFVEKDIPHNVFLSCGDPMSHDNDTSPNANDDVRLFIFPKIMSTGVKNTQTMNSCCYDLAGYLLLKDLTQCAFNSAFLELGGYMPIGDIKEYDEMDEFKAIAILNRYAYHEDEFEDLKYDVLQILKWDNNNDIM